MSRGGGGVFDTFQAPQTNNGAVNSSQLILQNTQYSAASQLNIGALATSNAVTGVLPQNSAKKRVQMPPTHPTPTAEVRTFSTVQSNKENEYPL
jgi:hypothetical protein